MTPFTGKNRVTSLFGWRKLNGKREFHAGVDCVADSGSWDIREVTGNGRVIATSKAYNGGRGWLVKVQVGNAVEIYQHLSAIYVKLGQIVKQGELIGRMGETGYSFGPHLHFEVQIGGKAVEPSAWLGLPNKIGKYNGNNSIDGSVPTPPSPSPEPTPESPVRVGKYRVYNSIAAFSDKIQAIEAFKPLKSKAPLEYILTSIGDDKWRIGQVYMSTENIDFALENMAKGTDRLISGNDTNKYRLYQSIYASTDKGKAVSEYKSMAVSAPYEVILTNMGGDGKWRIGRVFMATENLEKAVNEVGSGKILS